MLKNLFRDLQKSKYIKVYTFTDTKGLNVKYYKDKNLPKDLLINPDHVFNHRGYRTVLTTNKVAESINPLNFNSKFDKSLFEVAINNNFAKDLLSTTSDKTLDKTQKLLIGVLAGIGIVIYLLLKSQGLI